MSTVVQDLQRATGGINDIETALLETGAIQSGDNCPIEDMDDAIRSLEKTLAPKSITSNGTYDPSEDNLDGYSQVTVNVQDTHGTKSITENGTYNATDDGVDGYSQVTVDVPSTEPVLGSKNISANGEYNASSDSLDGYSSVNVNVQPNLQNKTVTQNSTVTADQGYDGLDEVVVNVQPNVGSKNISANGEYNASSDSLDGYSSVTVNVPTPAPNLQDKTITQNGTVTADQGYDGLDEVTVNVQPNLQNKTVTQNSTVTADQGYDGLNEVTVNVPAPAPNLQDKTVQQNGVVTADQGYDGLDEVTVNVQPNVGSKNITTNGEYNASSDSLDGYSSVNVNVQPNVGTKSISANGEYNASSDSLDGYRSVNVDVQPTLQDKTVTQNGTVTADQGYDGLNEVTVNVQTTLQDKTVTQNGTVTADQGYDGLNEVTVNVQPNVGSKNITTNGTYNASSDSLDGYSSVTVAVSDKGKINVAMTKDTTDITLPYAMEKVAVALGFSGTPSTETTGQSVYIKTAPEASNVGLDFAGLHNSDYRTAKTNDKISFGRNANQTTGLFEGWTNFFIDNVEDDQNTVDKLKFASNITNMFKDATFKNNSIDLRWLELSSNTDASNMFKNCSTLQSIIGLDMSKLYTVTDMFAGCSALQHLISSGDILGGQYQGVNIDLSASAVLDIMELINSLGTSPIQWEGGYSTITVHADVFATLTAADLATIADKHYKVVSA